MPVLTRKFAERNQVRLGALALVTVLLLIAVALSAGTLKTLLSAETYRAQFTEAGGLRAGDEVRIAGLRVGSITDIKISDRVVEVTFTVDSGVVLGKDSEAAIKSATVLGRKFLQVTPGGEGRLSGPIPTSRTSSPFDVQQQLSTLTRKVSSLDVEGLSGAVDTIATTIAETPDDLRAVLDGLSRASQTISKRDAALRELLASAESTTKILADRSADITTLTRDGNKLLAELYERRQAINAVLVSVTGLVGQLRGLVKDNESTIGPALAELRGVNSILKTNRENITAAIEGMRNYSGSLGEAVSGGPWFYGYVANLVPTNMAQQTVDSLVSVATEGLSGDVATDPETGDGR